VAQNDEDTLMLLMAIPGAGKEIHTYITTVGGTYSHEKKKVRPMTLYWTIIKTHLVLLSGLKMKELQLYMNINNTNTSY